MADLTQAQLVTLASEINTDSKSVGYSPGSKTNQQIADLLNTPGLVASDPKLRAGIVTVQKILNEIVGAELVALTAQQSQALLVYLSGLTLDMSNDNVRAGLVAIFGAGSQTKANLQAAVDRRASRAETLFGAGTVLDQRDVSLALNRSS